MDPIATSGSSNEAVTLFKVAPLGTAVTTGSSTVLATLRKIGIIVVATTGQSNLAVVLIELGSLSAITTGSSTLAASLRKVGVLSSAMQGAAQVNATVSAIRALAAIATAGEGDMGAAMFGGRVALDPIATAGSGNMDAQVVGNTERATTPMHFAIPIRQAPPVRPENRRVRSFSVATGGGSNMRIRLSAYRPDPVLDTVDTYYEELAVTLLLAVA